jgi:Fic family protein
MSNREEWASAKTMMKHFHESNLIEGYDNEVFDGQLLMAWLYLMKQKELSHDVVKRVQKIVVHAQTDLKEKDRGHYRIVPVWIGGHKLLNHGLLNALMNQWFKDEVTLDPIISHIAFEKIHPFIDGNGRTGRLLMWWAEVNAGKEPTLFLNETKHEDYYPMFRGSE